MTSCKPVARTFTDNWHNLKVNKKIYVLILKYIYAFEELHDLYRSPNVVRIIKYRGLRLTDHADRNEDNRNAFEIR